MKQFLFIIAFALCAGCEKHWAEQLQDEVNRGLSAEFGDGCLDGYRMYGYDASFLHGRIQSHISEKLSVFKKIRLTDFRRSMPLVYFVSLKYEDDWCRGIRRDVVERFRLQYGAIEHRINEEADCGVTPRNRCFTFFMVTESNDVHVLSIDVSRNLLKSSWRKGRDFLYGSVSFPVSIWDATLPDRDLPEKILTQPYKEVFAVLTKRPFIYSCYEKKVAWPILRSFVVIRSFVSVGVRLNV